jgi:cytochrome c553
MKLRTNVLRTVAVMAMTASCAIPGLALAADGATATAAAAPAAAANAPIAPNAKAARDKISMCIGCHAIPGYKASFPELYHVPMIAGQNAKYIEAALNGYKSGARSHPTMDAVAASLSDQDIADVAAYYANLK